MDRETKKNTIPEPEQTPEEKPLRGLRRALRRIYEKTEPVRTRFVAGRNAFCRALRNAFDSVADRKSNV